MEMEAEKKRQKNNREEDRKGNDRMFTQDYSR